MGDMTNTRKVLVGKPEEETARKTTVDERITLTLILWKYDGVDWIQLAQERDRWHSPVNTVMNLRVP
jgi:hypothetical protein